MSEYEYGVQALNEDTGEVFRAPQEVFSTLDEVSIMCEWRIDIEATYRETVPERDKLAFRVVRRKVADWEPYDPA